MTLFSICLKNKSDKNSAIRAGDYLGYYTAAVMIQEGLGKNLYNTDLQRQIQSRFYTKPTDGFVPFPYPAYVAVFLASLGRLSFLFGRWILSGLMLFFLVLAILVGTRFAPILKQNVLATATFFLSCGPVLIGVLSAQNPALSMLFYSGAIWGLSQKTPKGDFLCGVCLGLWLFKHQSALILIVFFMFSRSWRILAGAALVGMIYYFIGSAACGWSWPITWLSKMPEHAELCFKTLSYWMISILGTLKALSILISGKKPSPHVTDIILPLAFFIWIALKFRTIGNLKNEIVKRARLQHLLDLAGPAALLIAPRTLFYDFGICLLPLAKYVTFNKDRDANALIVFTVAITLATAFREQLPVQPLFLAVVGIFFFINRLSAPNPDHKKQS